MSKISPDFADMSSITRFMEEFLKPGAFKKKEIFFFRGDK